MKAVDKFLHRFQQFNGHPLYFVLLGLVALLDAFIVVIPIDGLAIAAALAAPKRWVRLGLGIAVGSTIGSCAIFWGVKTHGLTFVHEIFPNIENSATYSKAAEFIAGYGDFAVFLTGLLPVAQQPTAVITGLAKMPLFEFALWLSTGRVLKYLFLSGVSARAPHLVSKLFGVKKELDVVKKTGE